jgi:undecaprenyl-diphosphatase
MEKKNRKRLILGASLVAAFVLWTVLVRFVDVGAIGPRGSSVGFATLNGVVHELTGVNWFLYTVTDWLGLVPIAVALGFACLGLVQLIKRKSLWRVDHTLLALGVFYIVVISAYLFFEMVVINYRPTLIEGHLEASYPSSTTMLVMCVMPTAAMQLNARIKNTVLKRCAIIAIVAFTAFMVIARLLSGVHWITDIIGGALLSAGLVMIYYSSARH